MSAREQCLRLVSHDAVDSASGWCPLGQFTVSMAYVLLISLQCQRLVTFWASYSINFLRPHDQSTVSTAEVYIADGYYRKISFWCALKLANII